MAHVVPCKKFGLELDRFNADGSWILPMPAHRIIERLETV